MIEISHIRRHTEMEPTSKGIRAIALSGLLLLSLLIVSPASASAQSPGTFIPTGSMTTPRVEPKAVLLLDGKVLITGGSEALPASAELYDPVTGGFTATGDLITGRSGHSATLLPDGRILIAGGRSTASPPALLGTAELYDPSTGAFTATGNMVTPQSGTATALLNNGKVLITGGAKWTVVNATCCYATADPELYDPSTGVFTSAGEYSVTGFGQNPYGLGEWGMIAVPTSLLPDGRVLLAGEPSAQLYDVMTGTFHLTGVMTTHYYPDSGRGPWYLAGRTATLLTDGRVLVTGGEHEDLGNFADAELYDPSTGKFTATGKMSRPRVDHTATLLRDGKVLIAGTQLSPGVTASTELYDPGTGTFVATPDMGSPRFRHSATLLMDGKILLTGGYTSWPPTSSSVSAELYVPFVLVPAQVVLDMQLSGTVSTAGGAYSAHVSGSNLTSETFFDVRFTSPESHISEVVLNWQRGVEANHTVSAGTASGIWTINGIRAHGIETDHTSSFVPVSATITVLP